MRVIVRRDLHRGSPAPGPSGTARSRARSRCACSARSVNRSARPAITAPTRGSRPRPSPRRSAAATVLARRGVPERPVARRTVHDALAQSLRDGCRVSENARIAAAWPRSRPPPAPGTTGDVVRPRSGLRGRWLHREPEGARGPPDRSRPFLVLVRPPDLDQRRAEPRLHGAERRPVGLGDLACREAAEVRAGEQPLLGIGEGLERAIAASRSIIGSSSSAPITSGTSSTSTSWGRVAPVSRRAGRPPGCGRSS